MLSTPQRQIAAVFRIALQCSCSNHLEVIAWADQLISENSNANFELLELSTSAAWHVLDLISNLSECSVGSDYYAALRTVLGRMYALASEDRKKLADFAQGLYQIAQENQYQFPDDLLFCNRLEDEYYLACSGIYGDLSETEEDFLACLKPYWRRQSSTDAWYIDVPN